MGISQSFSNRKAREVLGWEPRIGYAAGLEATLQWLRAEGGAAGEPLIASEPTPRRSM
jgi:nucleoside-diphosphate-sugar epimerase